MPDTTSTATQYTPCGHNDTGWCLACVAMADRLIRLAIAELHERNDGLREAVTHLQSKLTKTRDGEWVGPMENVFHFDFPHVAIRAADCWEYVPCHFSTKTEASTAWNKENNDTT